MNIPLNDLSRSVSLNRVLYDSMTELLESGHYIFGPHTKNLETLLSRYLGVPFVRMVSSGTSALTIALKSLNLPIGSEIITSANSGSYARIAAEQANLVTRYVDVNLSGGIDINQLPDKTNAKTKALIVTHLYGQIVNLPQIKEYCENHQLILIEDCAQSFGAVYEGKKAGSWGHISTFSFYPTKNLAAMGDAGAIATHSQELHSRIKALSQYGWGDKYSVETLGGDNSRIDEIQALILCIRLKAIDDLNVRRREIWRSYLHALRDSRFRLIGSDNESFVAHLAVIDAGSQREDFREFLRLKGIQTAVHYPIPDYKQKAFLDTTLSLANTEYLTESIFSIPIFPELSEIEIKFICDALEEFSALDLDLGSR